MSTVMPTVDGDVAANSGTLTMAGVALPNDRPSPAKGPDDFNTGDMKLLY